MKIIRNPDVAGVFNQYPRQVQAKLNFLRSLILQTASEIEGIEELKETLKWGEPSYLCKTGSTLRIAWKASSPDQYGMYFNCHTTLLESFKERYPDTFRFSGNRAILFYLDDQVPIKALKHCIALTLDYHRIKGRTLG